MSHEFIGTVTRKSNGTIELHPADGGALAKGPAMGDEVTVTIEVTRTAAQIEEAHADARKARLAAVERASDVSLGIAVSGAGEVVDVASAPVVERRARK